MAGLSAAAGLSENQIQSNAAGLSAQGLNEDLIQSNEKLSEDLIQPDEALSENQIRSETALDEKLIQSNAAGLSEKLIQSETAELNQNLIKPNRADTLDPLVSILIPCYNTAPFLPACLESALRQTYTNIEIIATDDASTDIRVREILEDYRARFPSRLRVVYNLENRGLFHTRIVGAMHAKGSLITCLDSDDLFYRDDIIKLAVDAFKNAPSGMRLDFVSFGFTQLGAKEMEEFQSKIDSRLKSDSKLQSKSHLNLEKIEKKSPLYITRPQDLLTPHFPEWNNVAKLYRREVFIKALKALEDRVPLYLNTCEDMLTSYALLDLNAIGHLDICGYLYRLNATSTMNNKAKAAKRRGVFDHIRALNIVDELDVRKVAKNKAISPLEATYKDMLLRYLGQKISFYDLFFNKGFEGEFKKGANKYRWWLLRYKLARKLRQCVGIKPRR